MGARGFHLAEVNVARMKAPLASPVMADFVAQLAEINALAERSPGFVWRLADESGSGATAIRAFEDERILVNLSVWESVEALRDYTYRSGHAGPFRDRRKWFESFEGPHLALWWIEAGAVPTLAEAKRRLELVGASGPTEEAFTFRKTFAAPSTVGR